MQLLHVSVGGYSWLQWALELDVLLLCLGLAAAYYYVVVRLRTRIGEASPVSRSQAVTFSLGIVMIYAAAGSPMHELADTYLASAHMLQHILLMLVVAPLLLAGTPVWVWQALIRKPEVMRLARILTHPVMALAAFNAVFLLTHLPTTVDAQLERGWFHLLVHTSQVGAGLLMWWPILSKVPELPRLSYPSQMGYLFVQSLLPMVFASFIIFADSVFYSYYETAPGIWNISPIEDQQVAGMIMKLLGSVILWVFIAVAFFRWYQEEQSETEQGPRWSEVPEELEELSLSKR